MARNVIGSGTVGKSTLIVALGLSVLLVGAGFTAPWGLGEDSPAAQERPAYAGQDGTAGPTAGEDAPGGEPATAGDPPIQEAAEDVLPAEDLSGLDNGAAVGSHSLSQRPPADTPQAYVAQGDGQETYAASAGQEDAANAHGASADTGRAPTANEAPQADHDEDAEEDRGDAQEAAEPQEPIEPAKPAKAPPTTSYPGEDPQGPEDEEDAVEPVQLSGQAPGVPEVLEDPQSLGNLPEQGGEENESLPPTAAPDLPVDPEEQETPGYEPPHCSLAGEPDRANCTGGNYTAGFHGDAYTSPSEERRNASTPKTDQCQTAAETGYDVCYGEASVDPDGNGTTVDPDDDGMEVDPDDDGTTVDPDGEDGRCWPDAGTCLLSTNLNPHTVDVPGQHADVPGQHVDLPGIETPVALCDLAASACKPVPSKEVNVSGLPGFKVLPGTEAGVEILQPGATADTNDRQKHGPTIEIGGNAFTLCPEGCPWPTVYTYGEVTLYVAIGEDEHRLSSGI